MKILKSGIEMTHQQMEKAKGGACACGCNSAALGLNSWADDSDVCACNCEGTIAAEDGGGKDAQSYL